MTGSGSSIARTTGRNPGDAGSTPARSTDWDHVSPGQIKSFQQCPVKWYRESILKMPRADSPALELGRAVHAAIETAIRTGKPVVVPDTSPVWASAQRGVDYVDVKAGWCATEVEMSGETAIAGVPVVGRIDVLQRLPVTMPAYRIVDWKTTSRQPSLSVRLKHWNDPQTLLYGDWVMKTRRVEAVEFAYVYLLKPSVGFTPVTFRVEQRSEEPFVAVVREMKRLHAGTAALQCTCGKHEVSEMTNEANKISATMQPAALIDLLPAVTAPPADLELYIDCAQLGGPPPVLLDDVIAKHSAAICARYKIPDLRLIEFGKGTGFLLASIRANPPSGVVVARSSSSPANEVIAVLVPLAKRVFIRNG